MKKKKALLVVAGGRAVPNVLSLLWLQPQVVRVILSKQGWDYKQAFIDIACSIPDCQIDIIPDIDAYNFDLGLEACQNACEPYPDDKWEWTFDITSAPKITGIAAYEVAKQKGASCWHVDAQRERHVSLVNQVEIDTTRFFHLTLDDYMRIQNRTWKVPNDPPDYRNIVKKWAGLARELVISPDTQAFLSFFYAKKKEKGFHTGTELSLPSDLVSSPLLKSLLDEGLLNIVNNTAGETTYHFASLAALQFIGTGDWLEFYVWHETISSGLADEEHCQWGCKIFEGTVERDLDLALMYQAQLIIAECKSDKDPFNARKNYLHKLEAKANVLGGSYVCKLFITNQPATGDSYRTFCEHAAQYKVVVVTAETLPDIAQILKKQATQPKYPRI